MSTSARTDRLVGLDVARCLALVGMVATHVVAARTAEGDLSVGQWVAGGRASALFALLAGVGLALVTGGQRPVQGTERTARSAGIVVRALLIATLGLALGGLDSGLAVILTNYGLLFLLATAFLALTARPLLVLGAVWVLLTPAVSHLVRPGLPARGFDSPTFALVHSPGEFLSELFLTGYYPVLPWLAYLLVGLGVGRLDLTGPRVPAVLVGVGAGLAVSATVVSHLVTARPSVVQALLTQPPATERTGPELLDRISTGMFGVTPSGGAWEWLLVVAPHSATPFDLAQTIGTSLLVLGLCLLLTQALPEVGTRFVAVLFGAGAMTLSLYSLHVVLRTPGVWPGAGAENYAANLLVLLVIGAVFAALRRRGPLEATVRQLSLAAAAVVGQVLTPDVSDRATR
ncbi:MAG: DUF1624 domain-containing protein [Nocardioides sp.]|nr:DUF1624 domain-containing protein [Nocardioides sp.]